MAKRHRPAGKRKRGDDSEKDDSSIVIRNLPTNVDFSDLNAQVGKYIAQALTREEKATKENQEEEVLEFKAVKREDEKGREAVDVVQVTIGDNREGEQATTKLVANIRLVPQSTGKRVSCKGYGFMSIVGSNENIMDLAAKWTDTLNGFACQVPLQVTTFAGKTQQQTLLFRCGSAGHKAEEHIRANGRAKKAQVVDSAGARLLALIESHGGTMHIKHWPKEDRKGLNELGKRRKIKPADAAKAAGV
ncbi:MAG: hypothetical protein SGARI_007150, partial [Bacillariaceae sp.]